MPRESPRRPGLGSPIRSELPATTPMVRRAMVLGTLERYYLRLKLVFLYVKTPCGGAAGATRAGSPQEIP